MKRTVPQTYYVYEFSYPEGMPELAGRVFYVGKGTSLQRMNNHLGEAATGCDCRKCRAIRSIWDANLVVVRRIVFETLSEDDALQEEHRRIQLHLSPFLTNIQHTTNAKKPKSSIQEPITTRQGNEQSYSSFLERLDDEWENYQGRLETTTKWRRSQESDMPKRIRLFTLRMKQYFPSKRSVISLWEEQKMQGY